MQFQTVPDIFEHSKNAAICIPIHGSLDPNGSAVMDRGMAFQLYSLHPGVVDVHVGNCIVVEGLRVHDLGYYWVGRRVLRILTFPYAYRWDGQVREDLIERSARQVVEMVSDSAWWERGYALKRLYVPVGDLVSGGLAWDRIEALFDPILMDDRIIVVAPSMEDLL